MTEDAAKSNQIITLWTILQVGLHPLNTGKGNPNTVEQLVHTYNVMGISRIKIKIKICFSTIKSSKKCALKMLIFVLYF